MGNDVYYLMGFVTVFIVIGFAMPFINDEFGDTDIDNDYTEVTDDMESASTSATGIWTVIFSIAKMFFWTFGSIPAWLDVAIFVPMRIAVYVIVARNVWIGGGS